MHSNRLGIYVNNVICFIPLEDVVCLKADYQYTKVVLFKDQKRQTITQSYNLGRYTDLLNHGFIQPRNNYIVNVPYIDAISIKEKWLRLREPKNAEKIYVPKKKWTYVRKALGDLTVGPYK